MGFAIVCQTQNNLTSQHSAADCTFYTPTLSTGLHYQRATFLSNTFSEEKIQTLLGKVVIDVLEKVAREIIAEVAEKMIREKIDALKKSIIPED